MMSRETLVLLPGLLCDRAVWGPQCEALAGVADCVVPDWGARASLTAMAEQVLQEAPTPRFSLAGHSMGGRVAFEVLRLAPERVTRLALLDTGAHPLAAGEAGERERAGRMALLEIARREGMRAMGRQWARGMVHPERLDTPLFDAILDMIGRRTPEVFAAQIEALLTRRDATPQLAQIRCTTLLLCGRDDAWSPPAQHERMRAAIPGSRLVAVDRCGHMSTMEQSEAVSRALAEWLETPAGQR